MLACNWINPLILFVSIQRKLRVNYALHPSKLLRVDRTFKHIYLIIWDISTPISHYHTELFNLYSLFTRSTNIILWLRATWCSTFNIRQTWSKITREKRPGLWGNVWMIEDRLKYCQPFKAVCEWSEMWDRRSDGIFPTPYTLDQLNNSYIAPWDVPSVCSELHTNSHRLNNSQPHFHIAHSQLDAHRQINLGN
jgi:hypothetical protein